MTTRDHIALAADYQAGVLDGSIPACKWVRLACERNRRDLDRQDTPDFPYRFDPVKGAAICRFGELLPAGKEAAIIGHDEEGQPIYARFLLEPWQCWILSVVFGWVRLDGLRRFRVWFLFVPRKNGKSSLCAVVALYMLTEEREVGAQVYSLATTRDQARNIAEIAWEMAQRSPSFLEFYGVRRGSRTSHSLLVPATASKFLPLSADANSLDGLNISCAFNDEFQNHKTAAVWNVVDTATSARKQPLIAGVGTAGETFGGIAHSKLGYLERILDGTIVDEHVFGVNYTMDPTDDYRLVATARKANPNFGVSVDPADIARKVAEAQHSPEAVANLLTKHFNIWQRSESAWMSSAVWQTCTSKDALTLDNLRGYPLWIGVDLGEVRDPSACSLLFQLSGETYALIPRIYIPAAAVDLSPIAQLPGWVRSGHVIETPGSEADYQRIEDDLIEWCQQCQVREIDFDRHSARLMIQKIKQRLEPALGRDAVDLLVIDVPQSVETMDPAMKLTERLVVGKRLQHDGNPVMAWMISNIVVERNYKDEIYPRKAGGKDSPNKIDGPVAMFTALSRAMRVEPVVVPQLVILGGR